MAIKITRKNNGLNNALRGAERGLNNGMQLGMQARQAADQRLTAETNRKLALQQAARVGQQIDMELAEKAAAQEGIAATASEYGSNPTPALNAGMRAGPAAAYAVGGAQQDKWSKIGAIAKRMDPDAARLFLEDAKRREMENVQETGRNRLRDEITEKRRQGAYKTDPESAMWLDPQEVAEGDAAVEEGAGQIIAGLADPNSDVTALATKEAGLSKSRILAEGSAGARAQFFQGLTDQANTATQASGGMFSPAQGKAIRTMMAAFRQTPRMYDDPKAMAEFQSRWQDALQGYTKVGNERIRFEDEPQFRKLMMERAELMNRLTQSQIASEQSQGRYYDAGAQGRLTPKAPTPSQTGEMSDAQRQGAIMDIEKILADPMTDPGVKARLQQRMQALEGAPGPAAPAKGDPGVTDAQIQGPVPSALKDIPDDQLRDKAIEMGQAIKDPAKKRAFAEAALAEMKRRGVK